MAALALGAPLLSAAAGASTVGLFGSAGVFSLAQTLATLGTIASVASGVGTLVSGFSGAQSIDADAVAAGYNADLSEQDAAIAASQTDADVSRLDRENRLRRGALAARSGSGATGSALDILADNAAQEELDILTVKHEGMLTQRKYLNDANLSRYQAKSARSSAALGRGGALLRGTASLAGTVLA